MARSQERLLKREAQRLALLHAIYDACYGAEEVYASLHEIFAELDATPSEADAALIYLKNEGLIEQMTESNVGLLHEGVREIERSIKNPGDATERFEQIVVKQHFHGPVGAVQNGDGNVANVQQVFGERASEILNAIARLRAGVEALPPKERAEAAELIEAVEVEVKSPSPRMALAKSALGTLQPLLQAAPDLAQLAITILGLLFGK